MRHLIIAALSTLTLVAGAGAASAFERHVTVETPRGTLTGSAEIYCFDGACYREAELTGVNGSTLKRSGMCTQAGANEWNCKGTVTGPQGNTRTRQVHISLN